MTRHADIPLVKAAQQINIDQSSLRRALNRFALTDKRDDGQRVIPASVVALFRDTREKCGYLYPRNCDTRDKLFAAAAKIDAY
jgi:hypothetical protein